MIYQTKIYCRSLLVVVLSLFSQNSFAQFENNVISVALDNTAIDFDAFGWEPQSSVFSTGNSAMKSLDLQGGAFPSLSFFTDGDITVSFDFRLDSNAPTLRNPELSIIVYNEFGRILVQKSIATTSTNGFRDASVYVPAAAFFVSWQFEDADIGIVWLDNVRIDSGDQTDSSIDGEFAGNFLSQAVDNTDVDIFTNSPGFLPQTEVVSFGRDAVESAPLLDGQTAFMGIEFNGPEKEVFFDWRVSSQKNRDYLAVTIYDLNFEPTSISKRISGQVGWNRESITVPGGLYYVVWSYSKDGSGASGEDKGWVDRVTLGKTPAPSNTSDVLIPYMLLLDD